MSRFAVREATCLDPSRSWSDHCSRRLFTDVKISFPWNEIQARKQNNSLVVMGWA